MPAEIGTATRSGTGHETRAGPEPHRCGRYRHGAGRRVRGRALAEAGLHVTAVESRLVGGECPYYGCIPSKMMIRAANLIAETRRVPGLAGTSTVTPDWSPVALRIREEATDYWNDKKAADRFIGQGGHLVRGSGMITAPDQVTVRTDAGDRVFQAGRGIVIASGTEPAIPPIEGLAGTPYWTNRDIVQAEQVPESLIILGGGAIGAEFAQVFARFGADGHGGRGAAQAAVVRGTRGQRADRADLRRRGHHGAHERPGRAGQPRRDPLHRAPGRQHRDRRAAAGRDRPPDRAGRARRGRGRA